MSRKKVFDLYREALRTVTEQGTSETKPATVYVIMRTMGWCVGPETLSPVGAASSPDRLREMLWAYFSETWPGLEVRQMMDYSVAQLGDHHVADGLPDGAVYVSADGMGVYVGDTRLVVETFELDGELQ